MLVLTQILARAPLWVWPLFLLLVGLGWAQSRARTVGRGRVMILPVIMLILSLAGLRSAFGLEPVGLAGWGLGLTVAVALGWGWMSTEGMVYCEGTRSFFLPGSWLPLVFMLALFFTKFAVGVMLARQLPLARTSAFVASVSVVYGLCSGVFLARALVLWRLVRRTRSAQG